MRNRDVLDQATKWNSEWKKQIFVFLRGLNDDIENVRSYILNSGTNIEEVYAQIEVEE